MSRDVGGTISCVSALTPWLRWYRKYPFYLSLFLGSNVSLLIHFFRATTRPMI